MSQGEDPDTKLVSLQALAWGVAGLLGALAIWRWTQFGSTDGGDFAQHLLHARALAEGRSYGDIGYLYSPFAWMVGPPLQPVGLPLTLVPLLALPGVDDLAPRLLMHVSLAFLVWLGACRFREADSGTVSALTALVVGASLLLIGAPNTIGSDLGCAALIWGVISLSAAPHPWSRRRFIALALVGCAAIAYRPAAIPIIPALCVVVVFERRLLRWETLAVLVAWCAVFWVTFSVIGAGQTPEGPLATTPSVGGAFDGLRPGPAGLFQRSRMAFVSYRFGLMDGLLYPFPWKLANALYHLAAVALMALGLARWSRARWRKMTFLFAGAYGSMLLLAPVWDGRYLWFLYPLIAFGFVSGLSTFIALWRGSARSREGVLIAVVVVLVLSAAWTTSVNSPYARPPERSGWEEAGRRLRAESDEPRAASNRPRKLAWYASVPSMAIVPHQPSVWLAEMRRNGVTHVVIDTTARDTAWMRPTRDSLESNTEYFRRLATAEFLVLYEVTRPNDSLSSRR